MVTQVEVYYKNSELDDSANLMIKSLDQLSNSQPIVNHNIKNEGNGGWMELKDCSLHAFLGSSRVPELGSSNWFIMVSSSPVEAISTTRLLRNYQKKASLIQVGL